MKPSIISLKQWGNVLTGREFGAEVCRQLSEKLELPVELDFAGVEAMGSSFGDEVIPPLARAQKNRIRLLHVNEDMKSIINAVAKDASIEVDFID